MSIELAPNMRRTFDALATLALPSDFYLAGGTALALQVGHRISYDLDFFSTTISLGMDDSHLLSKLNAGLEPRK